MKILTIGIDLGKRVFHLVGLHCGEVVVRKKFSRAQSATCWWETELPCHGKPSKEHQ